MMKSPWFTLVIGLMVGLGIGYVIAERQPIPPARAVAMGLTAGPEQAGLPQGHPPIPGGNEEVGPGAGAAGLDGHNIDAHAAELLELLGRNPTDGRLMVQLGDLYFDAARWQESRLWYERALELVDGDPNLLTDLAVVYRNLKQPEKALELLDRTTEISPDHWQAWYNKVVVQHFDLHDHAAAAKALDRLEELKRRNPQIPDLSSIAAEVRGS